MLNLNKCTKTSQLYSILRPRYALPSPFPANNAFSMGKKTPSQRYAMRPIVNMSEEDRATDTGNMQKKLVKIARVVPEISCRTERDRPADRYTHHNTSQPLVGEVTKPKPTLIFRNWSCVYTSLWTTIPWVKKGATITMAIALSILGWICKILSLLQRAVNFQQNQY